MTARISSSSRSSRRSAGAVRAISPGRTGHRAYRVDRGIEDELHPDVADDIVADLDRQAGVEKRGDLVDPLRRDCRRVRLSSSRRYWNGAPARAQPGGAVIGHAADDALAAEHGGQRLDIADAVLQCQRECVPAGYRRCFRRRLVALLSTRTIARSTDPIAAGWKSPGAIADVAPGGIDHDSVGDDRLDMAAIDVVEHDPRRRRGRSGPRTSSPSRPPRSSRCASCWSLRFGGVRRR